MKHKFYFKKIDSEMWFALRIAFLISFAFCIKCMCYHNIDTRLTTWIKYGLRTFPYAWWAYVFVPILFIGVYIIIRKIKLLALKSILFMILIILATFIVACFIFTPPTPNYGFIFFMGQVSLCCILAIWVRYIDTDAEQHYSPDMHPKIIFEVTKQKIEFWKGITVAGTLGFLWVLLPLSSNLKSRAGLLVTDRFEQYLVQQVFNIQIWTLFFIVLLGPIIEAIRRLSLATNALLEIKHE